MLGESVMYGMGLALVVCILVGILKTPLIKFKSKSWFKPVLTFITVAVTVLSVFAFEHWILHGIILSEATATLLIATFSEVYGMYNVVYEGTHLKKLCNKLIVWLKEFVRYNPENALTKAITKLKDKGMNVSNILTIVNKTYIEANKEEKK